MCSCSWGADTVGSQMCGDVGLKEEGMMRNGWSDGVQMCSAARSIGDEALEKKFKEASESIHRGIMFANSLYLED